ncbi:ROK family protein [bacterium]|nr:ROK family protein [bacterium]
MRVLAIDIGGTHVKILVSGETEKRAVASGPTMTPRRMVTAVKKLARGWTYDVVAMGYPGPVLHNAPMLEPHNLGHGWVGFDYRRAFGKPVRILNDAAMQALGSYRGGRMLFLGLGTGLGTALVIEGQVEPLELAHLPYKKGRTFEDYVGLRGLERLGKKKWRREVAEVVARLRAAMQADYVVVGGGNAKKLADLPKGVELGDNANAFLGGFRMWEGESARGRRQRQPPPTRKRA